MCIHYWVTDGIFDSQNGTVAVNKQLVLCSVGQQKQLSRDLHLEIFEQICHIWESGCRRHCTVVVHEHDSAWWVMVSWSQALLMGKKRKAALCGLYDETILETVTAMHGSLNHLWQTIKLLFSGLDTVHTGNVCVDRAVTYPLVPVLRPGSVGSVCFGPPGSGSVSTYEVQIRLRILLSSSKNSKKNLDSYCFVTSFCLLSLKKWCKCSFEKL